MKITIKECLCMSEDEIIKIGKKHNLTETQIENLWCTIREIPLIIEYDTQSEKFIVKHEKN